MLKNILKLTASFSVMLFSTGSFAQANADCNTLEPICSNSGVQFTASSNVQDASITNPGNDYNCLSSSPNPTWYYMQVGVSGNLQFSLSAPQDIDFIIYGPFANLVDAQNGCNSYGNGGVGSSIVDCSYSSTNMETPVINGAVVGEIYVLLITNYANSVQNVDFTQTNTGAAGAGDLDCNIITIPPCVSDAGTFVITKNGNVTQNAVYLCENDQIAITSNGDYILPNDTIAQPIGDGIYTAQLLWLVYSAPPVQADPTGDPGFLNFAIPNDDINDMNNGASPIITNFGCGTYYFVPVAGDDGVGNNNNVSNGLDDNGSLHWDKNGNGCYNLGAPIEVTYACAITTTNSINCNPPAVTNGIDIQISGGDGNYTIVNTGSGNLASTTVPNGGTATIADLENNNTWSIAITDSQGCTANASGVFSGPVITNVTITPAASCPAGTPGQVDVTVNGTSGQGAPYEISMAGGAPVIGTTQSYNNVAGTIVPIVVADAAGCTADSIVTITSAGNYVDVQVVSVTGEDCYGDGNGSATITVTPVDQFGNPNGNVITSIVWTDPSNNVVGITANTHLSETAMAPGIWVICATDNTLPVGCEVCVPIEITSPQELDVFVTNSSEPNCYGDANGSFTISSTGGSPTYTYFIADTTDILTQLNNPGANTANLLTSGWYQGTVTDANGCTDSIIQFVSQPDSIWAQFTLKDIDCYGDNTGGIIIDTVWNNQGNIIYIWEMNGVVPDPPTSANSAISLPAGTYTVTVQDAQSCSNQYQFTLVENPEMVFDTLDTHAAQCRLFSYQNGGGVLFASGSGGAGAISYSWVYLDDPSQTSSNSTWGGRNPGSYQITLIDALGCQKTETIVLDSISPNALFTVTSDQLDGNCEGTAPVNVHFVNQSTDFSSPNPNAPDVNGDTTFFWHLNWEDEFPNGGAPGYLSESWYEELDTTYTGEVVYEVCLVAINIFGCEDIYCKDIIVHDQPQFTPANIFTPGNSGENDVFQFYEKSQAIETFRCTIVDRWGVVVTEFNAITDSWNGDNKNGRPCNDGVYFYTYEIVYTNAETESGQGNVTLIREP